MPADLALVKKSWAPCMLPWSVMATAPMPCRSHSAKSSLSLAAPSSIEYSVCTWRCTNDSVVWAARDTVGV
jgi:hypothetical protein